MCLFCLTVSRRARETPSCMIPLPLGLLSGSLTEQWKQSQEQKRQLFKNHTLPTWVPSGSKKEQDQGWNGYFFFLSSPLCAP